MPGSGEAETVISVFPLHPALFMPRPLFGNREYHQHVAMRPYMWHANYCDSAEAKRTVRDARVTWHAASHRRVGNVGRVASMDVARFAARASQRVASQRARDRSASSLPPPHLALLLHTALSFVRSPVQEMKTCGREVLLCPLHQDRHWLLPDSADADD